MGERPHVVIMGNPTYLLLQDRWRFFGLYRTWPWPQSCRPHHLHGFLSSIVKNDNCVSSESSRLLDGHGFIYLFRLIVDEDT